MHLHQCVVTLTTTVFGRWLKRFSGAHLARLRDDHMSVEELSLGAARDIIKSALPEAVYLYSSFIRLKERKFSAISEQGTLFRRVTVTAALALICGFATY